MNAGSYSGRHSDPDKPVKVHVRDYIAGRHARAGVMFGKQAHDLEASATPAPTGAINEYDHPIAGQIISNVLACVMLSVATMEVSVNELFADADQREPPWRGRLTPAHRAGLAGKWHEKGFARGKSLIQKCDAAFEIVTGNPMSATSEAVSDMRALVGLRNGLMHDKPKLRPHGRAFVEAELDPLEQSLAGRFAPSRLFPETVAFIWVRCLGGGCARWAVRTTARFSTYFYRGLGHSLEWEVPEWAREA